MVVEIRPIVLRDVSYVLAHLRQADADEIWCQLPEGTKPLEFAGHVINYGDGYTACVNGQPVACFGTQPMNAVAHTAWAFGTNRMHRTIPAITDFMAEVHIPKIIEQGARLMEARSIRTHSQAHVWMIRTGAKTDGVTFPFGRKGERFLLFRWTVPEYHTIRGTKSRWKRERKSYVHRWSENPKSTEGPAQTED